MAIPVFPDQNLSSFVQNFTEQLDEDFQSPTVSKFQDYMPRCRAGLQSMEEVRSRDRGEVAMKGWYDGEGRGQLEVASRPQGECNARM